MSQCKNGMVSDYYESAKDMTKMGAILAYDMT